MNGEIRKIFACPACGEVVSGFESECPRCKKLFDATVKFDCPFCGESIIAGSISCPSCHIDFEEIPPEAKPKPQEKSIEQLLGELQVIGNGGSGRPPSSVCPKCGAIVLLPNDKCQVCGAALAPEIQYVEQVIGKPPQPAPTFEVPGALSELLKEEEAEVEWACPSCGKDVGEEAMQCPYCKTVFEAVEEEGPAKEPQPSGEEEAIEKLTGLLELVKESKPKKIRKLKAKQDKVAPLQSKTPPRAMVSAAGRVNGTGLVNGRGAVNGRGLVNGRGATNGRGLVNGKGATNGKGLMSTRGETNGRSIAKGTEFVNGTGVSNGIRPRRSKGLGFGGSKRMVLKWQFLVVIIVILIVIPAFVYLSYSRDKSAYSVDGNLGDWRHATVYAAQTISSTPGIVVDRWSFDSSGSSLFFYVRTVGAMMATQQVESILLYVDEDNSVGTGYLIDGIGADFLLTVDGWNGSVQSTSMSQYTSQTDHLNWNLWTSFGSLTFALSSNQLEASALLSEPPSASAKAILVYKDESERESVSQPVPVQGSLLIVEQRLTSSVELTGIIDSSTSAQLLRLNFTCEGGDGSVTSVSPSLTDCALSGQIQSFNIAPGETVVRVVSVDTSSASAGQTVSATVMSSSIQSSFDSVKVLGASAKAYVQSVPASIVVDGAFGDWVGKTSLDSDIAPVQSANVDIDRVGAGNDSESAYFYVSVKGDICYGSFAPVKSAKPSGGGGGGGGPVTPTRLTAEDTTKIFVDTDNSVSTGHPMTYNTKSIGADALIEIRGLFGEIVSAVRYDYISGTWTQIPGTVEAANDDSQLEVGVLASSLDGALNPDFIIETTSWNSRGDYGVYDPSAGGASMQAWVVSSAVSENATSLSCQRKLFYDGTNFWSFYFDGSNTVYKYSTDNGKTWTLVGALFKTAGVDLVSIWYDSANNIVYAVGDTSTATTSVTLQRGTVAPATHAISWASGQDETLAVSQNPLARKHTFISKDASGYVWVMSSNLTSSSLYNLTVFRSTSTDSITSFVYSESMLPTPVSGYNVKGSILPAGTGSNMWAVYGYMGNVAARKYTGTWSAETVIYNIGNGNPANTYYAPPCAVVDGKGVIHVVYGNGHEQPAISKPFIYYVYNAGSSWSVPYRLESVANTLGNLYPTISLDSSTGNVYAFWIQTDTNGVGRTVMGKKNVSGTWSALTLSPQTADPKQYLSSIYSVSGEAYVCWQWTQNTTASPPIQVIFDKIPEFSGLTMPVMCFVGLFIVVSSRLRGKKFRKL